LRASRLLSCGSWWPEGVSDQP